MIELISGAVGGDDYDRGGVGLTCHTKNEVVIAAMKIQSMINGDGALATTNVVTSESGILVSDTSSVDKDTPKRKFALILPFDIKMMKTAKMLLSYGAR